MGPDCQESHAGGEQPLRALSWKEPTVREISAGKDFDVMDVSSTCGTRELVVSSKNRGAGSAA